MEAEKPKRKRGRGVFFRVDDACYNKLRAVAKLQHRRSVADLFFAKALELAESAEAAR